jgi:hypothetical protein
MKKIIVLLVASLLCTTACEKDDLKLVNPNDPSLGSLSSEDGLKSFALGILEKPFGVLNSLEGGGNSAFMIAVAHHSIMGDDMYMPWGNWGVRWSAIYESVTLPNGSVNQHTLYPGISQQEFIQANNSRAAGEVNSFKYEWIAAYQTIGQCNYLLDALQGSIAFSGNADTKKKTLQAWALWWKGYMYSRIGSIYLAGLIVDEFGTTNAQYVDRNSIIAEATENFDAASAILATLDRDGDYDNIMNSIVMSFNDRSNIVSPETWVRMINTYKARNILVNKKIQDMTDADWTAVQNLAQNGMTAADNTFNLGMTPDGVNDLADSFWHPAWLSNIGYGWWFVSERLIQEYKPGDERYTRAYDLLSIPEVNKRNRGLNFGTEHYFVNIEDGGMFATADGTGLWPIGPTYEENELMLAEAKLRKSAPDIAGGLTHVDNVRNFQNAGLTPVSGVVNDLAAAREEFRKERRVALALRGLSFYDARRWNVTAPTSQGGGRSDAHIMVPANLYDPESDGLPGVYPCQIVYNYMDYWDLPADELDFNKPIEGSANVKN